jgi:glycyl-tRNA synthetase
MKPLFRNGLVSYDESDILRRESLVKLLNHNLQNIARELNPAIKFFQIETPLLIPTELIAQEHDGDFYNLGEISLRPETTKGSYYIAKEIISRKSSKFLPICVWQVGKSFRREQTKPLSKLHLKEFYQMEYQFIMSASTMADWPTHMENGLSKFLDADIVDSDRLPSYSSQTHDLEIKGVEIASCSLRNDFGEGFKVYEIAFGIDRLLNFVGVV